MIRNPNDIVEKLVADLRGVFGERLLSVVMYGSAVTHEFCPGKSDVNVALVFDAMPVSLLEKGAKVFAAWMRRGVAAPLLLTPEYLATAPVDYPVEFLDVQQSCRVLAGDDLFAAVKISRPELQRQCRRELLGLALQLRKEFVRHGTHPKELAQVLVQTVRALIPLFKAIVLLYDRKVPMSKAELITAVEDLFGLGSSVLSEVYNRPLGRPESTVVRFDGLLKIVEMLVVHISALPENPVLPAHDGVEVTQLP
jgi:hypothetical protein